MLMLLHRFMIFLEPSPIAMELNEINHRYQLLEMKLGDRQADLETMREELKKHAETLKALHSFLDRQERQMPREQLPSNKDDVDKQLRLLRVSY